MNQRIRIAVLDDYQHVALTMANWSTVQKLADITVFDHYIGDEALVIETLIPFDIICVMRERTPITRNILQSLPDLKLIVSTGKRNASIDIKAVEELEIELKHTGYVETGAPEMTWALLMALARHIPEENDRLKNGNWQQAIATDLSGKTIGIIGLGRVGTKMARYAKAFDMNVIAWSQNLTKENAEAVGAKLVSKEEVFIQSDFVTIHLVLSDRSRDIIGQSELSLMKPSAYLINTSRGPLINEQALIKALRDKKIAGAALDVFDVEPLPVAHVFRTMDNVLATPHIGYVTENTYKVFYQDTVKAIEAWLRKITNG
jgi:phosphoglycerate dehydrogenase-like enzyme